MNLSLTLRDFAALSPLLIVLIGALLQLLCETFFDQKTKRFSFLITVITLVIAIYASLTAPTSDNPLLTPWLKFDSLSQFFTAFFLIIGLATAFLSASFFQRFEATHGEYYFLLLSSLFGLILIGSSADFLTLFIGLETLSISLYILCGYMKKWELSHEGAIKYFLIGSIAAAFLLYGIALIYGAIGTTNFSDLLSGYHSLSTPSQHALFLGGVAFLTMGLAFKAAIVPFHFWAPDAYDGSPNPVTAFMAVGTKVGAFAAFIIVFLISLPGFNPVWNEAIALLAYPTLIYANILALRQFQMRRFMAYSGISHAGFLLIPLASGTPAAIPSMLFYLIVYGTATLGAFSVMAFLDRDSQGATLKSLNGLFHRSPLLAGLLSLCLLTLAGIPPTIGFFAKFYIFKIAFEAGFHLLVIVGLLTTILSAYYYLRIIALLFTEARDEKTKLTNTWPSAILGVAALAVIAFLSCYPAPLLSLLQKLGPN